MQKCNNEEQLTFMLIYKRLWNMGNKPWK